MSGTAETPMLVWEPSPDPSAIGYMVFWGSNSGSYTRSLDVGAAQTFKIPDAVEGERYFLAVSAYNAQRVLGPRSPEVTAVFPGTAVPVLAGGLADLPPEVVITMPTTLRQHHTLDRAVVIGGTASDDAGISSIRWQNSRGGEGRATGTDAWIANVPVYAGSNSVSVTAIDTVGNQTETKITIYRRSE